MSLYSSIRTSVKTTTKAWLCQKAKNAMKSHKFIRKSQKPCTAPDHSNREFSIVHERRHVTPCLSSAPFVHWLLLAASPVCGQREISRFGVQDLGKEFSIVRWLVNEAERRHMTSCLSSAPSSTGYCQRRHCNTHLVQIQSWATIGTTSRK